MTTMSPSQTVKPKRLASRLTRSLTSRSVRAPLEPTPIRVDGVRLNDLNHDALESQAIEFHLQSLMPVPGQVQEQADPALVRLVHRTRNFAQLTGIADGRKKPRAVLAFRYNLL
jgi:hypothetical protein